MSVIFYNKKRMTYYTLNPKKEGRDMIEVDIPSIDPIQHEPKLIFGMTLRQAVCVIVGGGAGIVSYLLVNSFVQNPEVSMAAFVIFMLPACCLGWYKPYNMKCEDYLKLVYYNNFVSYPTRILKTDNAEDIKMLTQFERMKARKDTDKKFSTLSSPSKKAKAMESVNRGGLK